MVLIKNRSTRALILIMIALVTSGFLISHFYYQRENASIDPRVITPRKAYNNYDKYASQNNFIAVFRLLDSIEMMYENIEHYKNSYEKGVIFNNRAAAYLTLALFKDSLSLPGDNILFRNYSKDSLLRLATVNVDISRSIHRNWLKQFADKNPDEIEAMIKPVFYIGLEAYERDKKERFLKKRIEEISLAQEETKRRLSVSYTNLGIIQRHRENYKQAIYSYKKAIDLWDRNLTAENNLNKLLGRPVKKRNFIQKMFPPKKDKK